MSGLPTLRQLQYLSALAEHGHFGRAAAASFVTQSTLSAGLKELEALLGHRLAERGRHGVRLLPLGERVLERAHRLLAEAEAIVDLARATSRPLTGELRLGVIPTIAPFLLPRLLPGLRRDWPQLRLYLREDQSDLACRALAEGRLDAVLLALPWACGQVETVALFDDPLLVAFPAGEAPPPSTRVDPATLDERSLLLLEDGHCLTDHALAACGRQGFRPDPRVLGTSLHTLVQMVDNRLGLTLLPALAIEAGILEGTGVEARPLGSSHAHRTIALAWRRSSARGDEFRLLAGALAEGFSAA